MNDLFTTDDNGMMRIDNIKNKLQTNNMNNQYTPLINDLQVMQDN
jgi:hypothetical protein